jgi:hypothetical protein
VAVVYLLNKLRKQPDILFQPDSFADLDEVFFAHAPVFGVVQKQICQLTTLLDQVDVGQTANPVVEPGDSQQFAQNYAGVVKAQRLVEIADKQIVFHDWLHVPLCSYNDFLDEEAGVLQRGRREKRTGVDSYLPYWMQRDA